MTALLNGDTFISHLYYQILLGEECWQLINSQLEPKIRHHLIICKILCVYSTFLCRHAWNIFSVRHVGCTCYVGGMQRAGLVSTTVAMGSGLGGTRGGWRFVSHAHTLRVRLANRDRVIGIWWGIARFFILSMQRSTWSRSDAIFCPSKASLGWNCFFSI